MPGSALLTLTAALVITRLSSRSVSFPAATDRTPSNGVCDLVVAPAGLVDSLPLWPIIALAVRLGSRGPALFRQEQVTKAAGSSGCPSSASC
jgi:lipopolysaccharide/colanic/teichoic acid biosynthesis glycosyltransferase